MISPFRSLIVVAFLAVSPTPGLAQSLSGPTVSGTTIQGKCYSDLIATPQDVASAAQWTGSQIMQVGRALREGQQEQMALSKSLHETLVNSLRDLGVQEAAAKERVDAQKVYGEQSRPNGLCSSLEMGAGAQVGKKAEGQISSDILVHQKAHNASGGQNINKQFESNAQRKDEELSAQTLYPPTRTLKADEIKAAEGYIRSLTNPFPTLELTSAQKRSPSAVKYDALAKQKETRLSLPQKALAEHVAAYTPTMELGEWAKDAYTQMGAAPEGVVDGKISPMQFIELLVDSRIANPNWYVSVASMNEVGLMREALLMQAAQMEMQRRNLKTLMTIAILLAEDQAAKANTELNASSWAIYNETLSEDKK